MGTGGQLHLTQDLFRGNFNNLDVPKEHANLRTDSLLFPFQRHLHGMMAQQHPFEVHLWFDVFRNLFRSADPWAAAVRVSKTYQLNDFELVNFPAGWV